VHRQTIVIVLVVVQGRCQTTAYISWLITFAIDLLIVTVPTHVEITHPVKAFEALHIEIA
jgi:hypothetical protein